MAGPVFYDSVAEWTQTPGLTRPYVLNGAIPGARGILGIVTDGDWGYFQVEDSARFEVIEGRFVEPNTLETLRLIATSNGGAAVSWPAAGRRIVRLIPRAVTSAQALIDSASIFWLGVAAGVITDLGDLSDAVVEVIEMGEISAGDSAILALDLGELLSVPVNIAPTFWVEVAAGTITDLGDLSDDAIIQAIEMGEIIAGADVLLALDLGEFLSVPVNPDNPMFWTVLSLAQFSDLGRLSDQVVMGVDMGNLAGIAAEPGEATALDLGGLA